MTMYFRKASHSYEALRKRMANARDPYAAGKPLNSAIRAYLRRDPDYEAPVIDLHHRRCKLATVYPDNTVEFTATKREFAGMAQSLTITMHHIIPCATERIGTGRYTVATSEDYRKADEEYVAKGIWKRYSTARRTAQEYFQHLKVDLSTGKVINSKDMTPVTNEDKRKQWVAGLKKVRLHLRTLARIGAIPEPEVRKYYFTIAESNKLAEAIMRGECSEYVITTLAQHTSKWREQRSGKPFSECVVETFESMLKHNSRAMRLHVGVIDIVE